jgi:hypothetical protein
LSGCFLWADFYNYLYRPYFCTVAVHGKGNFVKNRLGNIFGNLFTNSSGRPGRGPSLPDCIKARRSKTFDYWKVAADKLYAGKLLPQSFDPALKKTSLPPFFVGCERKEIDFERVSRVSRRNLVPNKSVNNKSYLQFIWPRYLGHT